MLDIIDHIFFYCVRNSLFIQRGKTITAMSLASEWLATQKIMIIKIMMKFVDITLMSKHLFQTLLNHGRPS